MSSPSKRDRGHKPERHVVTTDHFEGIDHQCQMCLCDTVRKHCRTCLRPFGEVSETIEVAP